MTDSGTSRALPSIGFPIGCPCGCDKDDSFEGFDDYENFVEPDRPNEIAFRLLDESVPNWQILGKIEEYAFFGSAEAIGMASKVDEMGRYHLVIQVSATFVFGTQHLGAHLFIFHPFQAEEEDFVWGTAEKPDFHAQWNEALDAFYQNAEPLHDESCSYYGEEDEPACRHDLHLYDCTQCCTDEYLLERDGPRRADEQEEWESTRPIIGLPFPPQRDLRTPEEISYGDDEFDRRTRAAARKGRARRYCKTRVRRIRREQETLTGVTLPGNGRYLQRKPWQRHGQTDRLPRQLRQARAMRVATPEFFERLESQKMNERLLSEHIAQLAHLTPPGTQPAGRRTRREVKRLERRLALRRSLRRELREDSVTAEDLQWEGVVRARCVELDNESDDIISQYELWHSLAVTSLSHLEEYGWRVRFA